MSYPTPTRRDHLRFCEVDGWQRVRSAAGRRGTHHDTYELVLSTGEVLRTRISRPPDRSDYGPDLWAHILRDQLRVTDEEFWRCVRDRVKPRREPRLEHAEAIPADLVWKLKHDVGLSDRAIAEMSKREAVERMQRFWMTGE